MHPSSRVARSLAAGAGPQVHGKDAQSLLKPCFIFLTAILAPYFRVRSEKSAFITIALQNRWLG